MSSAAERAGRSGLPIDEALPALREALAARSSVVLQAPPGAGKSTVVPIALLEEPWARGKRLLMLEPRRLAARAVAERMAATLGEPVGRTVGYRMRFDTRVSRDTRIEVITEGVLTRLLQADPALEGVALVLFDEFHERSLQTDLGLALALDAQAAIAPQLKLLVMSATVDAGSIAEWLGGGPPLIAAGRAFPVETRYVGRGAPLLPEPRGGGVAGTPSGRGAHRDESAERFTARVVQQALSETEGDVLVFLPGAREIRRVQSLLVEAGIGGDGMQREAARGEGGGHSRFDRVGAGRAARVLPLYGDLAATDQDLALAPAARGTRKVILSTNIAETSLTVQGVRAVVDGGLVRRSVFDPVTGMSRLTTQRISRASADQRQGRAGRLEAGVCYRLWSEEAHRVLAPRAVPEIVEADLAPLALELAAWGVHDSAQLRWLDPPPPAQLSSARDLLERLGALDAGGRITSHGRDMVRLAAHPRLAHMLLEARRSGELATAGRLAALLSERDVLPRAHGPADADIRTRLELLEEDSRAARGEAWGLERVRRTARALERQARMLSCESASGGVPEANAGSSSSSRRLLDASRGPSDTSAGFDEAAIDRDRAGSLLALAYPDRIGLRRAGAEGGYLLANGRGASFAGPQSLARRELIVAVDLDDRERNARILLAAPVDRADIEQRFADRLVHARTVEWSGREQAVLAQETERLGAIVLAERPLRKIPPEAARAAILSGIRVMGLECLPWSREARNLQARVELLRRLDEEDRRSRGGSAAPGQREWPAMSDAALAETLESWLAPWLEGVTRRDHLGRVPLLEALHARLSWDERQRLDALAPESLTVPSGSRVRIDYLDESAPVVAVRLQEVFGLAETPRIGGRRIPITFKLLSPAQRPVQITRDLASFWRGAYAEVRKDLRGRYPKHYWPENPLEAQPTRRVRPRK